MTNIYKTLNSRKEYLLYLLKLLDTKKTSALPFDGTLRVSSIRGTPCYYYCHKDHSSDKDVHTYIKKSEVSKFQPLAQSDYEKKLRKAIEFELSLIERFLSGYKVAHPEDIYQNLHPARKALITPIIPDWSEFVSTWQKSKPPLETFWDPDTGLVTEQGETVRSKSEKIIADKYYSLHIPYLYEKPLVLKGGRLLITFETSDQPLNIPELQTTIDHFLSK